MFNKFASMLVLFGLGFAAGCDRRDSTPPKEEGAVACGGFAGTACPGGQVCVDDPSDGCDPQRGGADCGGICAAADGPAQAEAPTQSDECKQRHSEYVKTDPETCAAIRFKCHDGQVAFSDDCGCGCETP